MSSGPDRWRRLEEICHAALELTGGERETFLASACADTPALRAEVDRLLAQTQKAARFLASPIDQIAARVLEGGLSTQIPLADRASAMIGRIVTHYRIVEHLGGGGMGVVYRADDTKLGRSSALKFLPSGATRDPVAKRRFMIEAQAASALDHPNICTIYEVDETTDGELFIAMAYYAGETLKAKIERGPLKQHEVLDYAIQIAHGLIKAHAAGIVHRDIKPANVLVTIDGLVKILDFGVAKLLGTTTLTQTGATLGTLAYMSPEQLAGKDADARSDIWSLGVVLYEMLTGQVPFKGEHPHSVAHAIEQAAPLPMAALRTGLSMELERVVDRALAKNPDDRYQTAADLLSELRRIGRDSASQLSPVGKGVARSRSMLGRRLLWAGAAASLALAATLVFLIASRRGEEDGPPRLTNPVQVAGSIGEERSPSWSTDGRMLAYQSDQAGNNDIWITQIGGTAINRTADFTGSDEAPRLSPDGRQIAFWSAREGAGLFLMPTLAGSPRKIAPGRRDVGAAAVWSPDGAQIAYPVVGPIAEGQPRLEILDLRSGKVRRVSVRVGGPGDPERGARPIGPLDMAWSPNGRLLAVLAANSYNNQTSSIWTLRLNDAKWTAITSEDKEINWSPSWSPDSRSIFFTSNRGTTMDLWRQRIAESGEPSGAPDRVTTGLDVLQATFTSDGTRVAYAKGRRVANVWRVPILSARLATWSDAQQVTIDQRYIEAFDLSPDGQRLVVASDRGGHDDIWILPAGGGEMQQLTDDPTPDWWPAWSPDGREVAFYSNRTGNRQLWVQPVAGGPARRLTDRPGTFPRWSRDGKNIFFDGQGISIIPAVGGEPRQIMKTGSQGLGTMEFSVAPDGRSFVTSYGRLPDRRLWRFPASGGDGQPLTKGQATAPSWSPDGKWIYFTTFRDAHGATYQLERPGLNIWRVAPDGSSERSMTNLAGRRGYLGANIATDGRWVYFTWREDIADIWVMDVERLAKR